MKKIILFLVFLTLICGTVLNAHDQKPAKEEKVYCCHEKNQCDKLHTKADCEKEGGKVVTHCRECK